MNVKQKAHAAVLLGNFFFGTSVVALKHITPNLMPPLAVNVLRVSIALILFWCLYLLKPSTPGIKKEHIGLFILCALTGVAVNQILFVKGTSLTSPIHASLLSLVTPIAITLIAAWLLKDSITLHKIIGLVLGVTGAAILILSKNTEKVQASMLGDVLIIFNAISYAFYLVLAKPLMQAYKPVHVIRWVFLFGACCIIPLGFNDVQQIKWAAFLWHHWLALGFVVIGATFIAYLCMVYGIAHLGAAVTGTYIYTQPVFATIAALILFKEQLSVQKILAALLIFAGVFWVNKQSIIHKAIKSSAS
jgi:drug/metabolite transporter (DMT)-like permease